MFSNGLITLSLLIITTVSASPLPGDDILVPRKATRCSASERGQERCSSNSVQECIKENGGNHYVWKMREACALSQMCECWTVEDCRCAPKLGLLLVQDGF